MAPIKSVLISGKINDNDNKLSLKLLPNELSTGLWSICIQSLAYALPTEINTLRNIFSINCNLITSQKYLKNGSEVENYEQPLAIFILDGKLKKKTFLFSKDWFQVNVFSNELIITLNNLEKNTINTSFEVFLVILFQKV